MTGEDKSGAGQYRVLARKYRPVGFDALIGQEAMVRTLTNAINSGRLAHAFILTGVRGVGKTTTARIIARALNCVNGPTPDPCGVCENCVAIAEDRHMDVLEMDAASRTGVDDIRELIEGVRYRPTGARYKIYIIDEIHMLSKNAFNALLKTLEEPPEHVKFIFATTEIRKVPVTVLSRCQRFDLKRIDMDVLAAHFRSIAEKEGADVDAGALHLLARAADGSVRDGLSLLDQAIAHTGGTVSEESMRDMLGLADRTQTFDLFDRVMRGDIAGALDQMARQYASGADPVVVLSDLLELTHWITRIKVTPKAAEAPGVPEAEKVLGRGMAEKLPMAAVARAWQMLLKGLGEARNAPSPLQAAEMVLVRLAYAADLPAPVDALKKLKEQGQGQGTSSPSAAAPLRPSAASTMRGSLSGGASAAPAAVPEAPPWETRPQASAPPSDLPDPADFAAVVALAEERREAILHANLINNFHLVRFEKGHIEFRPGDRAPAGLAHSLSSFLTSTTGYRWVVSVSNQPGQSTIAQTQAAADQSLRGRAMEHPTVKSIMAAFPGATIERVTPIEAAFPQSEEEASDVED